MEGRDFAGDDPKNARVVIINETAVAAPLWPGEDPIGRIADVGRNGRRA